jgi:hypothetical protein
MWVNIVIPLPEAQMKGLVAVSYDTVKPGEKFVVPNLMFLLTMMGLLSALPKRYSSIHFCLKNGNMAINNSIFPIIAKGFPRYSRVRMRFHYGSDMELQYQLQGHGIPSKSCPVDNSGDQRQDILNVWYHQHLLEKGQSRSQSVDEKARRPTLSVHQITPQDEADSDLLSFLDIDWDIEDGTIPAISTTADLSSEGASSIEQSTGSIAFDTTKKPEATLTSIDPKPEDILLGRGKAVHYHPGNVRFREWLDGYRDEYENTPRAKKHRITTEMTHRLNANGICFLKQTDNKQWVTVDSVEAEEKIRQLFRSRRKQK